MDAYVSNGIGANFSEKLKSFFAQRKLTNPGYSLRAYARDLDLSPSRLSEVMNKGQKISLAKAHQIIKHLRLPEDDAKVMLAEATLELSAEESAISEAAFQLEQIKNKRRFFTLHQDETKFIANWEHSAIFEAFEVKEFPSTDTSAQERWLEQRFSLPGPTVFGALRRLIRLGLLREENKRYVKTKQNFATTTEIPSDDLRSAHSQLIRKGLTALETQSIDDRTLNTMVLSIQKSRMAAAKRKLHEFCRQFNEEFGETNGDGDEVYCLSSQFFRIE